MAKVIVLGNKNLAVGCTAHLLGLGEQVAAVVLNPDDQGMEGNGYLSLKRFAESKGLRTFQPAGPSDPDFLKALSRLSPDFLFSFSYSRIIRKNVLDLFKDRAFNLHFSLLPRNRGCMPLIYALAEGDRETGATLHVMDEGIDTGDIVSQVRIPISESDTARTLYFRATAAGISLFAETYPRITEGSYARKAQSESEATYHPQRNPNDRWIDWRWDRDRIHAFIRAHSFFPYPGARFSFQGQETEVTFVNGQWMIGKHLMDFEDFLNAYR